MQEITLIISIFAIIISVLNLWHQFWATSPCIYLKTPSKTKQIKKDEFSLITDENDNNYFLSKFVLQNFSPIKGCVFNFQLKYNKKATFKNISQQQFEVLSQRTKNYIKSFAGENDIIHKQFVSEPFNEQTIVLIFKIDKSILKSKRCKLKANYFGDEKKTIRCRCKLPEHIDMSFFQLRQNLKILLQHEKEFEQRQV